MSFKVHTVESGGGLLGPLRRLHVYGAHRCNYNS